MAHFFLLLVSIYVLDCFYVILFIVSLILVIVSGFKSYLGMDFKSFNNFEAGIDVLSLSYFSIASIINYSFDLVVFVYTLYHMPG